MEKRKNKRILNSLDAEIVSAGISYPGTIANFSAEGVHMVTATAHSIVENAPSTKLQLKCTLPSGERISMECTLIWFKADSNPEGAAFKMGMQIENPPASYLDFVKTIQSHQS